MSDVIARIPTYIIGLEKPEEKIEYLKKFGINAEWFQGLDGNKIPESIVNDYMDPIFKYIAPKGLIGCAISHMKTWELAINKGNDYTLIFENDVVLKPNFNDYIDKCLRNLPNDFDVFYLGAIATYEKGFINSVQSMLRGSTVPKNFDNINNNIKSPYVPLGTHAYIISKKGALILVNTLKKKIYDHIDICMLNLYKNKKIKSYIAYPELAYQTSTYTLNESRNSSSDFPYILNKPASKKKIDKYMTADYWLNINLFRLGPFVFNTVTFIFLGLGILLALFSNTNLKTANIIFLVILVSELTLSKINKGNFLQILLCYILFISPFYFKLRLLK